MLNKAFFNFAKLGSNTPNGVLYAVLSTFWRSWRSESDHFLNFAKPGSNILTSNFIVHF